MQISKDTLFLDVERVLIAHEFTRHRSGIAVNTECRQSFGLTMCISGSAEFRFKDRRSWKITVRRGDILFIPQGLTYSVVSLEEYRHYTVNFILNTEASVCSQDLSLPILLSTAMGAGYDSLFSQAARIWSGKEYGFEMLAVAKTCQLLCLFFGELREGGLGKHPLYSSIFPAKKRIERDFCAELSIKELSSLCNMSETGFRRAYKSVFGETAMAYRDRLRIMKAKDLLAAGYNTVSRVATLCGFSDVSYFCRFFRKHTGLSPAKYSEGQ